jgi:hypothetical protein
MGDRANRRAQSGSLEYTNTLSRVFLHVCMSACLHVCMCVSALRVCVRRRAFGFGLHETTPAGGSPEIGSIAQLAAGPSAPPTPRAANGHAQRADAPACRCASHLRREGARIARAVRRARTACKCARPAKRAKTRPCTAGTERLRALTLVASGPYAPIGVAVIAVARRRHESRMERAEDVRTRERRKACKAHNCGLGADEDDDDRSQAHTMWTIHASSRSPRSPRCRADPLCIQPARAVIC